jgi:uncharacterized protein (DUF2267 family)
MGATGLESIDHTVDVTHNWINDLDKRLGWNNKGRSYRLPRVVLQTLRDWLTVKDAVGFGAQLPILLRGIYYEHWRPAETPVANRAKADFLTRIDNAFELDPIPYTPDTLIAVFDLLSSKIDPGEVAHLRRALPPGLKMLFPESVSD